MPRFEKVGYIGVDSGQVMLIDPCYIKKNFESEFGAKPDLNYAGACEVTLSQDGCGNFGGDGMAFATRTAFGDGTYPVYVKRDSRGAIIEMKIKFV